jgi:hypothetical protein
MNRGGANGRAKERRSTRRHCAKQTWKQGAAENVIDGQETAPPGKNNKQ